MLIRCGTRWPSGRLAERAAEFRRDVSPVAAGILIAHVAGAHGWMLERDVQLYFWGVTCLALYAAGFFCCDCSYERAVLGIVFVLLSLV
jgi:hypothetical protein